MKPVEYEAEFTAAGQQIKAAKSATGAATLNLQQARDLLHRPDGPAALLAYFNGDGRKAADHIDSVVATLANTAKSAKEVSAAVKDIVEACAWMEPAIGDLYKGLRAEQKTLPGVPLEPVVKLDWRKVRLWREETELQGADRFAALELLRTDAPEALALRMVPPHLVRVVEGAPQGGGWVALSSGQREVVCTLGALVDDRVIELWSEQVNWVGLDLALAQPLRSEAVSYDGEAPAGKVIYQRRVPSPTVIEAEALAALDGIPAYEITAKHWDSGFTYYTVERSYPAAPVVSTPDKPTDLVGLQLPEAIWRTLSPTEAQDLGLDGTVEWDLLDGYMLTECTRGQFAVIQGLVSKMGKRVVEALEVVGLHDLLPSIVPAQVQAAIKEVLARGPLGGTALREKSGATPAQLKALVSHGDIVKSGKGKATRYALSEGK